jgi:hypothetical protein
VCSVYGLWTASLLWLLISTAVAAAHAAGLANYHRAQQSTTLHVTRSSRVHARPSNKPTARGRQSDRI